MKSRDIKMHVGKLFNLLIFLSALTILIATSESDIPSADSESVTATMEKESTKVKFTLVYENGPFSFDSLPLMLAIEVSHVELNETFDYDQQSWRLVTAKPDGTQRTQRVLFRRGNDDILSADRGKYTLEGTTSLFQCSPMSDDACIPCDISRDQCQFDIELIREGAPLPAELVRLSASQWLLDEGSKNQITLSVEGL